MSAADKRIADLLDRWQASLELHARYLELGDAAYASVQDWPKHERPSKWVVELARARLLELKRHIAEREATADASFAESLELMSFLTTLLGSEHIERFIPQAVARPAAVPAAESAGTGDTTTRQKLPPRPKRGHASTPPAPARPRPAPAPPPEPAPATAPATVGKAAAAAAEPADDAQLSDAMKATIIADAVRFLSWGREWPQLASSIARLADRPAEQDVWKVLRANRAQIESQARRPPD